MNFFAHYAPLKQINKCSSNSHSITTGENKTDIKIKALFNLV
jgi:hypothetical protein